MAEIEADIQAAETPLKAFVSSVIDREAQIQQAREEVRSVLGKAPFLQPWLFEYTAVSSENRDDSYLRHVRDAFVVIWLVGRDTTEPVRKEIDEALSLGKRLWIFRFPSGEPTTETRELLDRAGSRAKWVKVKSLEQFREALEKTVSDEIVRALINSPNTSRLGLLEELGRASRARCIERWLSAGVPYLLAADLADDPAVGLPKTPLTIPSSNVLVLIGDHGAGKSLLAERLLQKAILTGQQRADAPLPVYLEATALQERLETHIHKEVRHLGNPSTQGAFIVVDDAHEAGLSRANQLLSEARVLGSSWPNTTVVITSRPIPYPEAKEEVCRVQLLEENDASQIISRIAGNTVSTSLMWSWPVAIREAIRRPLFAVLMGALHKKDVEHPKVFPPTDVELVEHFIKHSIIRRSNLPEKTQQLLRRLAALSTDRGGAVPGADVGQDTEVEALLESTLVVEHRGVLSFPIQLFREWFASRCLLEAEIPIQDLLNDSGRLERWRWALVLAVRQLSYERAAPLLNPLVRTKPAFAGMVIREAVPEAADGEPEVPLPSAKEISEQIRNAMEAWVHGIGPLGPAIGPAEDDGTLHSCYVGVRGNRVTIQWYKGGAHTAPITDSSNRSGLSTSRILHINDVVWTPNWAWRETHEELASALSERLHKRSFPPPEGPLSAEAVWELALSISGKGSLYPNPLDLNDIKRYIETALESGFANRRIGTRTYDRASLVRINHELERRLTSGETRLVDPWPGPNQQPDEPGWVWDLFSEGQLLARTRAVYAGALEGYERLVQAWFPCFADRLSTMITLPARLVGVLHRPNREGNAYNGPYIDWWLEPLPFGSASSVDIRLESGRVARDEWEGLWDRMERMRPDSAEWNSVFFSTDIHTGVLGIFEASPATEIAYDWLSQNFRQIAWLQ